MKKVVSVFMVSVLALSIVLIGGPTAFAGETDRSNPIRRRGCHR